MPDCACRFGAPTVQPAERRRPPGGGAHRVGRPGEALAGLAAALGLPEPRALRFAGAIYAAERALLEGFRVIPLIHLPDVYGVGRRVKGGPGIDAAGRVALRQSLAGRRAPMKFRTRLLLIFTVAIVAAVAVGGAAGARQHAASLRTSRTAARRSAGPAIPQRIRSPPARDWSRTVDAIAASDAVRKIAVQPDSAEYYDYAAPHSRDPRIWICWNW